MTTRRQLLIAGLGAIAVPALAAEGGYGEALARAYGGAVDPAAVRAQLMAEIARATARADQLFRGQGMIAGTVAERFASLFADGRYLYADDEAGRDRAVADMNARVAALRPRLPEAFGALPIAQGFAHRMPAKEVAAGRGGYREAPRDGRPGAYYLDLRTIRARPAWTLPSVAFHELIPGHILQMSLEVAPPADRVKASGAYFEAWAIYAEELAAALGAYDHDPLGELGYLHWRLFRLGRGVADIGVGVEGWSPGRAAEAMRRIQGPDIAFIAIDADAERMAKAPGRVAAEALGALALTAWRPGTRSAWPAYHARVLKDGPWPFGQLEQRVKG